MADSGRHSLPIFFRPLAGRPPAARRVQAAENLRRTATREPYASCTLREIPFSGVGPSMAGKLNWNRCAQEVRDRRFGSSQAYDELPPVGSPADRARTQPMPTMTGRRNAQVSSAPPQSGGARKKAASSLARLSALIDLATRPAWEGRSQEDRQSILRYIAQAIDDSMQKALSTQQQRTVERAREIIRNNPDAKSL